MGNPCDLALSVEGLTNYLQHLVKSNRQLQDIWVMGEIVDARSHQNGHLYFQLKDRESSAIIPCTVWHSYVGKLRDKPVNEKTFILWGKVEIYPPHGKYQFIVYEARKMGEGLKSQALQRLRNHLESLGFFSPEKKRKIPSHPQTIAVVTSPNAAAWGDIQTTLKKRAYPGLKVLLSPAIVQGEKAPNSVIKAIQRVEKDGRAEVLILSRGGGAAEDLSCFNDERIVRAIADCSVPIVTGIGHQRDETFADLAADLALHTPTGAAQGVLPDFKSLIGSEKQLLKQKKERLLRSVQAQLQQARQSYFFLQKRLESLDPHRVLQRGFAIVRNTHDQIPLSLENINLQEELILELNGGKIKVQVTEILREENVKL